MRKKSGGIPLHDSVKQIKHIGINLTNEVKDLCSKNLKILEKEIEEDSSRKWKDLSCLWSGRIHSVKIHILPKMTYSFNGILTKISRDVFTETEKVIFFLSKNTKILR